jgi:hypothetical protein
MHTVGGVVKDLLDLVLTGKRADMAPVQQHEASQNLPDTRRREWATHGSKPWLATARDKDRMKVAVDELMANAPGTVLSSRFQYILEGKSLKIHEYFVFGSAIGKHAFIFTKASALHFQPNLLSTMY